MIATCALCGDLYDFPSEEAANEPRRACLKCWNVFRRAAFRVVRDEPEAAAEPEPQVAVQTSAPAEQLEHIGRDEAIARIRTALRKRSGKAWSVTGGRGTAWGWITVSAPPRRCTWSSREIGKDDRGDSIWEWYDTGAPTGAMGPADAAELGQLLGLEKPVHHQGESIPASSDYYLEFTDRAEGRPVRKFGQPYWD